jgi:hypothetical protein
MRPVHSKLKFTFLRPPKLSVASLYRAGIHWMVSELKHANGRIDATIYTLGCNLMHFVKRTHKLINVFEGYRMYYSYYFIDCNISLLKTVPLECLCSDFIIIITFRNLVLFPPSSE